MEAVPTTAAPAAPAPPAPAAPVVPAAPAPAAPLDTGGAAPAVMEKGGVFDELTIMNVGMIAIIVLALVTSIYCSRQQLLLARKNTDQTRKDIDELKANLQTAMGAGYEQT